MSQGFLNSFSKFLRGKQETPVAPEPKADLRSPPAHFEATEHGQFSIELFREVATEQEYVQNPVISPSAIAHMAGILFSGSSGDTKRGIARALRVQAEDAAEVANTIQVMRSVATQDSDKLRVLTGSAIWYHPNLTLQSAFVRTNQTRHQIHLGAVAIGEDASYEVLSDWLAQHTSERVRDVETWFDADDAQVVAMCALSVSGSWGVLFQHSVPAAFHGTEGTTEAVQTMTTHDELHYLNTPEFQAVAIPYADPRYSMYLFLPQEGVLLREFIESLDARTWEWWLKKFRPRPGRVQLPRFSVKREFRVNQPLINLGMSSAFSPVRADLTQLFKDERGGGENLHLNGFYNITHLEVRETGMRRVAPSGRPPEVRRGEQEYELVFDRPFFFCIRENQNGVNVMMGAITNL